MRHLSETGEPAARTKSRLLLAAIGKQLRRAYDGVLSEDVPLEIERAFEHLSDLLPKQSGSSMQ